MKICHVITGLQEAAGTSVFVDELAAKQSASGEAASLVKTEKKII